MKQIKVSTVKMTCDAQVINIDAHLVANAIKAQLEMRKLSKTVMEREEDCWPEDGGAPKREKVRIADYGFSDLGAIPAAAVIDFVQEFLDNLANAFLEDGDEKK